MMKDEFGKSMQKKIANLWLRQPRNFMQFLTFSIIHIYTNFENILECTSLINFGRLNFAYRCKHSQQISWKNSMQLRKQ